MTEVVGVKEEESGQRVFFCGFFSQRMQARRLRGGTGGERERARVNVCERENQLERKKHQRGHEAEE